MFTSFHLVTEVDNGKNILVHGGGGGTVLDPKYYIRSMLTDVAV